MSLTAARVSSVATEKYETERCMPPEVLLLQEPPRRASDVWSAGLVLFECVHGRVAVDLHHEVTVHLPIKVDERAPALCLVHIVLEQPLAFWRPQVLSKLDGAFSENAGVPSTNGAFDRLMIGMLQPVLSPSLP